MPFGKQQKVGKITGVTPIFVLIRSISRINMLLRLLAFCEKAKGNVGVVGNVCFLNDEFIEFWKDFGA